MEDELRTLQAPGNQEGPLGKEIRSLGPWFHNLHLPGGVHTAPDHPLGDFPANQWHQIAPHLPEDLRGWRVLDIGCNSGFYSFELARRGASVLAIDHDEHYLKQARWAHRRFGLPADNPAFRQMGVYDLAALPGTFDLVLFLGVFYHLRYPLLALDLVAEKTERLLLFQSLTVPGDEETTDTAHKPWSERARLAQPGWPNMAFIEYDFAGDPTNWWVPNRACAAAMLRSSGMRVLAQPTSETYLCEPDPDAADYAAWARQTLDALRTLPPGAARV